MREDEQILTGGSGYLAHISIAGTERISRENLLIAKVSEEFFVILRRASKDINVRSSENLKKFRLLSSFILAANKIFIDVHLFVEIKKV